MLTEKNKAFIESVALKIQELANIQFPNKYNYTNIVEFLKNLGAEFYHDDHNWTEGNRIHLTFIDTEGNFPKNSENMIEINDENAKIFFHETWHFISHKLLCELKHTTENKAHPFSCANIEPDESAAIYFSRAMILPEGSFRRTVTENVNIEGFCNIYKVAEQFDSQYTEIVKRGNDLNLWNKMG